MDPQLQGTLNGHITYISKEKEISGVEWTTRYSLKGPGLSYSKMFDEVISFKQIVDVDYKQFLIFYDCMDFGALGMKNEKIFMLVRDPNVNNDYR